MKHKQDAQPQVGKLTVENLPSADGWRAWHVFIYDFAEQDDFLCKIVAPLIESVGGQVDEDLDWFFIRYWEDGSHLRLRFRDLSRSLFDEIGEQLLFGAKQFAITPSTGSSQPSSAKSEKLYNQSENYVLQPKGTVAEIAYTPEIQRYGGIHCIRGCEAAFQESSMIALQQITDEAGSAESRRGLGLLLTAIGAALGTTNEEEFAAFLAATRKTWTYYLGELISPESSTLNRSSRSQAIASQVLKLAFAVREGYLPKEPIVKKWLGLLVAERTRIESLHVQGLLLCPTNGQPTSTSKDCRRAVASIFSSYNHMMMNRLGIIPLLEYEFATLLQEALQSRAP